MANNPNPPTTEIPIPPSEGIVVPSTNTESTFTWILGLTGLWLILSAMAEVETTSGLASTLAISIAFVSTGKYLPVLLSKSKSTPKQPSNSSPLYVGPDPGVLNT